MAASIWSIVHGAPVCVGQPFSAYCSKTGAAGWCSARPVGHILFRYVVGGSSLGGIVKFPWCVVHHCWSGCLACDCFRRLLFSMRSFAVVLPVTCERSFSVGGRRPLVDGGVVRLVVDTAGGLGLASSDATANVGLMALVSLRWDVCAANE